jgi:hypothetical protein
MSAAVVVYALVGLLFGAPDQKPNSVIDVYPNAASCEAAKVELMNKSLELTNGTTLIPAAKCVPVTRPDPA